MTEMPLLKGHWNWLHLLTTRCDELRQDEKLYEEQLKFWDKDVLKFILHSQNTISGIIGG